MKYITTLEGTIKNYSNVELEEMQRKLLDILCESYNVIDGEVCDNPIHRTLDKYYDMVRKEREEREIHKK